MSYTLDDEGKNFAKKMSELLLDYEFNIGFSKAIFSLYLEVGKSIKYNTSDPITEVHNMFFVNIFNSFKFVTYVIRK